MSETVWTAAEGGARRAPIERRLWSLWVLQADALAKATPVRDDAAYAGTLGLFAEQAAAWDARKVVLVARKAGAMAGRDRREAVLGAVRVAARIDRRRALGGPATRP